MKFRKEYSLTQKDYFKFNLKNIKRQSFIYGFIVVILAFLIRLYAYKMETEVLKHFEFWGTYFLYVVLGVFIVVGYLTIIVYISSKVAFKNNKNLYTKMAYDFDEEGIHQTIQGQDCIVKWEEFVHCYQTLGLYCFMISDRQGIIISKKIFNEEEQKFINERLK